MDFRPQRKVSTACSYCKQRKRKCSEKLPCDNCVASQRHCEYGETPDGRRKESIHRARLDSAFHKALLQGLLDKLRHGEDINLNTLIRSDATLEDLTTYLSSTPPRRKVKVETPIEQKSPSLGHGELCQDSRSPQKLLDTQSSPVSQTLDSRCGLSNIPGDRCGIFLPGATLHTTEFEPPSQNHKELDTLSHPCMQQPLNITTGDRPITKLLNNFQYACQQALSLGIPEIIVLGSRNVNLETALVGHYSASNLTISVWTCSLQQKFESLDVFVRLAFVHFISQYMRWAIAPTTENFDRVPLCMRPTPVQRCVPHHAAIDMCHLPALRDILIHQDHSGRGSDYEREDLVGFQVAGLRTNWQGTWNEAIVFDNDLGHHTLTPQFIDTVSRVDQWTAGSALLDKFPGLQGKMRFADERIVSIDRRQLFQVHASYR